MTLWNAEEHGEFVRRLKSSSRAVFVVAFHYHVKFGAGVEIPALVVSPSAADNVNHVDGGDLFVRLGGARYRLEVKHRRRRFTCADDWPDPHVFVSNTRAVNRTNGVSAYVIVNEPMTHAAIIRRNTSPTWYKLQNQPSNVVQQETVYCCPIERVQFLSLLGVFK